MSQQTSYSRYQGKPPAGTIGDPGFSRVESWTNGQGADVPAGIAVTKKTSTPGSFDYGTTATDPIIGFLVNSYGRDPGYSGSSLSGTAAIKDGATASVMVEGSIYAAMEQTMTPDDPVFVRFATSVNDGTLTQKGAIRKDADGVAQVSTITPTAVNSAIYALRVETQDPNTNRLRSFTFEYQADGSATATEIVTGFKTVMAADATFTALVVATGTTTLILTGQTAGLAFTAQSEGDGALAVAATTPPAPTARRLKGARVISSGTAADGGVIYFSAAVEAASF
jgi:hypothetical protein